MFVKHEQAIFQKVKNKKFDKMWEKAIVQRVLGATPYQVQYTLPDGSLGNLLIVHRNKIKFVCGTDGSHRQQEVAAARETAEEPKEPLSSETTAAVLVETL